ncbi:L-2-hydroxyglutarate oxidase [Parasalinivibrio latis]|uniref:L-2-hydroxyglutarate oxidase n=1 Tax=Parasalinivibrio latis TaxID=2952610 RepID=UPI0030DF6FE3
MLNCDFLVVGAGIVGLSTAHQLLLEFPGSSVIVVDKEDTIAAHQTGHNSGVIHAGVYYTPGSLKAEFCKSGNSEIKVFCQEHAIPFEECGKLLVATNEAELSRMQGLINRATDNGLEFEVLTQDQLHEREPNIRGLGAIFVPSTGIVSYTAVCKALVREIERMSGQVLLGHGVQKIQETDEGITVVAGYETIVADRLVACAGIMSDKIVKMLGLEPDFKMVPFRGDYFLLSPQHNQIINHLIYPIPDPDLPFLGVHLTKMIDGTVTVGPNAVVNFSREGYSKLAFNIADSFEMLTYRGFHKVVASNFKSALHELKNGLWKPGYLKQVQKYCPSLKLSDLRKYPPGIRAQAVTSDGKLVDDFLFYQTNRALVVCNAPSPAATSCFPIARHIVSQLYQGS